MITDFQLGALSVGLRGRIVAITAAAMAAALSGSERAALRSPPPCPPAPEKGVPGAHLIANDQAPLTPSPSKGAANRR